MLMSELLVQLFYKETLSRGRTEAAIQAARDADSASHALLNRLRSQPCNASCFDCEAQKPGWAALPHGVFICIVSARLSSNLQCKPAAQPLHPCHEGMQNEGMQTSTSI